MPRRAVSPGRLAADAVESAAEEAGEAPMSLCIKAIQLLSLFFSQVFSKYFGAYSCSIECIKLSWEKVLSMGKML
jgi:hypothetical protein